MLVLTRRLGESLMINEGDQLITVTCLGVKGNQVRLGISAPKDVAVHREEIYQRILKNGPRPEVATSSTTNNKSEVVA